MNMFTDTARNYIPSGRWDVQGGHPNATMVSPPLKILISFVSVQQETRLVAKDRLAR
jgi:hypothetical protein